MKTESIAEIEKPYILSGQTQIILLIVNNATGI